MGEEYGETAPFQYFIEHGDEALADAVREGRKKEFAEIGRLACAVDPQAAETFERSTLDWARRDGPEGSRLLRLYADLLALRREEPALRTGASVAHVQGGADWCTVVRVMPAEGDMHDAIREQRSLWYAFNTSCHPVEVPVPEEAPHRWRLRLMTDAVGYGGSGGEATEAVVAASGHRGADAPKRLLSWAENDRGRTVRVPAWSAVVYVRDFVDDGGGA
jgi:maltooligosyltrehalose trehalohydrolase